MKDYVLLAVLGAVFYGILRLLRIGRRPANYPPGPPTIPILGNIHQVLSSEDNEILTADSQT